MPGTSKGRHPRRSKEPAKPFKANLARTNAIENLLTGKTLRSATRETRGEKPEKPVEKLPKDIAEMADVVVAGRKIEREVSFKLEYAEKKVKDYCRRRLAEIYATTGSRSSSISFAGKRSTFMFIQTRRTSLTQEKVGALDSLGISVKGETHLRGIRINYAAIQRNKLETKLRDALEQMNIPRDVLAECFQPDVQFKDSFFDHMGMLVEKTLGKGEELASKIYEVLNILNPTEQIRNADLPNLNSVQSYRLIHESHIAEIGEISELEDDEEN